MSRSDAEIIAEIRAGNARSFALLVERHKDRAFSLAFRLTGEREGAEELVQDAFVKAYRNLAQYRGEAQFGTWFYRILSNLCMTRLRRRAAMPEMLDVPDAEALDALSVAEPETSLQQRFESEDLARILSAEVDLLPAQYRSAVTFFYLQELTYEEIAEVMELPLGTVKTCLFRGRNLLRKRMLERLQKEVKVA